MGTEQKKHGTSTVDKTIGTLIIHHVQLFGHGFLYVNMNIIISVKV